MSKNVINASELLTHFILMLRKWCSFSLCFFFSYATHRYDKLMLISFKSLSPFFFYSTPCCCYFVPGKSFVNGKCCNTVIFLIKILLWSNRCFLAGWYQINSWQAYICTKMFCTHWMNSLGYLLELKHFKPKSIMTTVLHFELSLCRTNYFFVDRAKNWWNESSRRLLAGI